MQNNHEQADMCVMYTWDTCHALSSVNNFCHGIHTASQGHCSQNAKQKQPVAVKKGTAK